jgi:adenylate cyclase
MPLPKLMHSLLREILVTALLAVSCLLIVELLDYASSSMVRSPLQAMDDEVVDLSYHIRRINPAHNKVLPEDVVIIDIDDYSIAQMGRSQSWPRSYDAKVINYIASGNPKAIAIDYLYTESDSLGEPFISRLAEAGVPNALEVGRSLSTDHLLAEAIDSAACVYLSFFDDDAEFKDSTDIPETFLPLMPIESRSSELKEWNHPVMPILPFASAAKCVGGINVRTSYDGTVRYYQAIGRLKSDGGKDHAVANFPIYMALDAMNIPFSDARVTANGIEHSNAVIIPLKPDGSFRINWLGNEEKFRYISFYKVWDELVPSEFFEGKYVFLGTSASGLQDLKTVPSRDDKMPGVEVHATAFLNMMNGAYLKEFSTANVRGIYLALAFIMVLVFLLAHPIAGVVLAFVFYFTYRFTFELWLLPDKQTIVPIASLMTLTLVCYVVSVLYAYFIRERRTRFLKNAFGTYVSPEIVKQISKRSDGLKLGGEKKELSVLFSDIRDFTHFSERFDSQQTVTFLNHYLSSMSEVIFKHQGTIDKFIGDAIMAVFGAPIPQQNHAEKACLVALGMCENLNSVNEENLKLGFPKIAIGIGINTGDMTVGNIGSNRRFDYTVIGDAVNLGARLEGLTKFFDVQIIVSQQTRDAVNYTNFHFRELGNVIVKGKEQPVKIYQLLPDFDEASGHQAWMNHWERAFQWMESRNLPEAIECLKCCQAIVPDDLATYYYIKSCEAYLDNPENFDLLIRMESK